MRTFETVSFNLKAVKFQDTVDHINTHETHKSAI